jgi:hypothetical protein
MQARHRAAQTRQHGVQTCEHDTVLSKHRRANRHSLIAHLGRLGFMVYYHCPPEALFIIIAAFIAIIYYYCPSAAFIARLQDLGFMVYGLWLRV